MQEDAKDAVSGSWLIVCREENRTFFYYYGFKRPPSPSVVSNSKLNVSRSAKLDFTLTFLREISVSAHRTKLPDAARSHSYWKNFWLSIYLRIS